MISPWSIRSHAVTAARAADRASALARALSTPAHRGHHPYCATQLLAEVRELKAEADVIAAKVKACEGSILEAAEDQNK